MCYLLNECRFLTNLKESLSNMDKRRKKVMLKLNELEKAKSRGKIGGENSKFFEWIAGKKRIVEECKKLIGEANELDLSKGQNCLQGSNFL